LSDGIPPDPMNSLPIGVRRATRWILAALGVVGVAAIVLAYWSTFITPIKWAAVSAKVALLVLVVGAIAIASSEFSRIRHAFWDFRDVDDPKWAFRRFSLLGILLLSTIALVLPSLFWSLVATPTGRAITVNQPIQVLVFPRTSSAGLQAFGCPATSISAVAIAGRLDRPLIVTNPRAGCPVRRIWVDQNVGLVLPISQAVAAGSSIQPPSPSALPPTSQTSKTVARELVAGLADTLPTLVQQLPALAENLGAFNVWDLLSNDALRPFVNGFSNQMGVGVADLLTSHFRPQAKAPVSLTIQVNNQLSANLTVQLALKFERARCPQRFPVEVAQTLASKLADTISAALAESLLTGASSEDIEQTISSRLGGIVDKASSVLTAQLQQSRPTLAPALTVTPQQGPPGTSVTIRGAAPRADLGMVHLILEGPQRATIGRADLGDALIDQTGHFSLKATIPTTLGPTKDRPGGPVRAGVYSINAWPTRCASSYRVVRFAVPFTG
jgi:hypothetical protein